MALTNVDDVAAMLRWGTAERAQYEGQIPVYIEAASQRVEGDAGPFEERTIVHVADGAPSIALPTRVAAVTSVEVDTGAAGYGWVDGYYVPDGSVWEEFTSEYRVDLTAGLVHGPFPRGQQNVRVTYTTGFDPVPEAAKLAATMVAVDMWAIASQRAPRLDDQVDPTYLMPKIVRDLLAPFHATQMPGFA
jgi:hypothetical protein